jgi:general secretion pathway protein C
MNQKKKHSQRSLIDKVQKAINQVPEDVKVMLTRGIAIVVVAYLLGSLVSLVSLSFMTEGALQNSRAIKAKASGPRSKVSLANYRDLRRNIERRNLFNPSGEFPEESIEELDKTSAPDKFDPNAPCVKSSLNLSLIGTIFTGNSATSFATIKDPSFQEADIYKVGDAIWGHETAKLAGIGRKKIVVNNNGVKECLEVDEKSPVKDASYALDPMLSGDQSTSSTTGNETPGTVVLDGQFVMSELGEGFGKIVQSVRFVPHIVENKVEGFKVFSIKKGSLLDRMGLTDGDVVTRVNDISLQQVDQGFALYQSLQDDKEINLHIMRSESIPMTINVRIK